MISGKANTEGNNGESKKHQKLTDEDLKLLIIEISLALVIFLSLIVDEDIIFEGMILGLMTLIAFQIKSKYTKYISLGLIIVWVAIKDIFHFTMHINFDIISFLKNCINNIKPFAFFWTVLFFWFFWVLKKVIFKYNSFFSLPREDYYIYLKEKNISRIINDKLRLEREQSLAKEVKKIIIGSYALVVGTIISFGVFLVKQPLSKNYTAADVANAYVKTSAVAFELALVVAIFLVVLQFIAYHFEIVGKQRIEIIDQCIEYRVNDKNGNNNDTVFGCVINDLKNKKILQLVEEKLKKVEQDEKKKNSQKSKQNTKGKQDAAQKPKQTTGEQDTAQKSKQNTEKKQDDSRKSKQGTEEEQANNPKLNSSGEKVQDDNDQGSNQDEQKKTREK